MVKSVHNIAVYSRLRYSLGKMFYYLENYDIQYLFGPRDAL